MELIKSFPLKNIPGKKKYFLLQYKRPFHLFNLNILPFILESDREFPVTSLKFNLWKHKKGKQQVINDSKLYLELVDWRHW